MIDIAKCKFYSTYFENSNLRRLQNHLENYQVTIWHKELGKDKVWVVLVVTEYQMRLISLRNVLCWWRNNWVLLATSTPWFFKKKLSENFVLFHKDPDVKYSIPPNLKALKMGNVWLPSSSKATVVDKISAMLIKIAMPIIVTPLWKQMNCSHRSQWCSLRDGNLERSHLCIKLVIVAMLHCSNYCSIWVLSGWML